MVPATQLSIVDDIARRYDEVIDQWGEWRDAQTSDETKALVDEVFASQCAALESIGRSLGLLIVPF